MKKLLIFISILSSGMAVKFSFEPELPRQEKSLLNTFPFNKQEGDGEHDHQPHHAGQEDHHPHHADQEEDGQHDRHPHNADQEDDVESNLSKSFKQPQIQLDARDFRQGSEINGVSFNEVSQAGPGGDKKMY